MDIGISARVGYYLGDVRDLMRKYTSDYFRVPSPRTGLKKFATIVREGGESYNILMSNEETPPNVPITEYSFMVTVIGDREERTREIMDEVEDAIGIELRPAPEFILENFKDILKTKRT